MISSGTHSTEPLTKEDLKREIARTLDSDTFMAGFFVSFALPDGADGDVNTSGATMNVLSKGVPEGRIPSMLNEIMTVLSLSDADIGHIMEHAVAMTHSSDEAVAAHGRTLVQLFPSFAQFHKRETEMGVPPTLTAREICHVMAKFCALILINIDEPSKEMVADLVQHSKECLESKCGAALERRPATTQEKRYAN